MSEDIAAYIDRIRTAYRQLIEMTGQRRGDWVSLTDLRDQCGGYRDLVDEALRQLGRTRGVSIVPESNQKALTPADRKAAIEIGNQHKHLIAIG